MIIHQASEKARVKILPSNSWRLTVNKRQSNLRTFQVISEVAKDINWGIVNLTSPDLEIRIEIVRDLTGISVMKPGSEVSMADYTVD